MAKNENNPFSHSRTLYYWLLAGWFVVNLFQAYFTELLHDEAYYHFYASNLAWGYYDHPPMVALLIRLGTSIFHNELGARLLICLMSVGTIVMIVKMTEVKNYLLFFAFIFSVFVFHAVGFLAVPDTPMIFFTTLFFYVYRNYLARDRWIDVLLLCLAIAGMMYSKYLGVFVVFFTFLSNLKLVKRKTMWVILIVSGLMMLPHLFWQINNDFVTFYFHLTERNRDAAISLMHPVNFILGQLALVNPLFVFFLFVYAFKSKISGEFANALRWNYLAVFSIGLALSFFKHIEANWTITAFIPMIILAYPVMENKLRVHKTVYILSSISIFIILVLRLYLVFDFIPKSENQHTLQSEIHGWDEWAAEVHEIAGDRPVVFPNSYQKAAKYNFYGGGKAFTFNYLKYRKNQFDLQNYEAPLLGKSVIFIHDDRGMWLYDTIGYNIPDSDSAFISGKWWYYAEIENYHSYNFVPVEILLKEKQFSPSSLIEIPVSIENPLDKPITFIQDGGETYLTVSFLLDGQIVSYQEIENISNLPLKNFYETNLSAITPDKAGDYILYVSIRSGWLPPGLNSKIYKVKIE